MNQYQLEIQYGWYFIEAVFQILPIYDPSKIEKKYQECDVAILRNTYL
jgi:hypothetical protein